jgi:hypothetical protein
LPYTPCRVDDAAIAADGDVVSRRVEPGFFAAVVEIDGADASML